MLPRPSAHHLWSGLKSLPSHILLHRPGRHRGLPSPQGTQEEPRHSSSEEGLKNKRDAGPRGLLRVARGYMLTGGKNQTWVREKSQRKDCRLESGEATLSFSTEQDNQNDAFSGCIRKIWNSRKSFINLYLLFHHSKKGGAETKGKEIFKLFYGRG